MYRSIRSQEETGWSSSKRLYYRIGEVSQMTGLKPHVLRYWESEFRMIKPHKAGSLQRLYRKRDVDIILRIKKLLYEERFTISGAKKKIREAEKEEGKRARAESAGERPAESERELLFVLREELQGIRDMLEGSSVPS